MSSSKRFPKDSRLASLRTKLTARFMSQNRRGDAVTRNVREMRGSGDVKARLRENKNVNTSTENASLASRQAS